MPSSSLEELIQAIGEIDKKLEETIAAIGCLLDNFFEYVGCLQDQFLPVVKYLGNLRDELFEQENYTEGQKANHLIGKIAGYQNKLVSLSHQMTSASAEEQIKILKELLEAQEKAIKQ